MIQRRSDTSFTNLWSLLLYIQSLLHYIENAQENKKNTMIEETQSLNISTEQLTTIGRGN
jgi:ABC-type uncharacterized transport system involved in gliding motility auxiliary subunit